MTAHRKSPKRQESFAAGVGRADTGSRFTYGKTARSLQRIRTTIRNKTRKSGAF
jgi:hypothetical protein